MGPLSPPQYGQAGNCGPPSRTQGAIAGANAGEAPGVRQRHATGAMSIYGETEAGSGADGNRDVARLRMETGSCSQHSQRSRVSCATPAPRLRSPHPAALPAPVTAAPGPGCGTACSGAGWGGGAKLPRDGGSGHPTLPAPTHHPPASLIQPRRSLRAHTPIDTPIFSVSPPPASSPLLLAGELSIKIGRTQLAGRAPARIVHSLSLTHHFVDAHKLLHYLF